MKHNKYIGHNDIPLFGVDAVVPGALNPEDRAPFIEGIKPSGLPNSPLDDKPLSPAFADHGYQREETGTTELPQMGGNNPLKDMSPEVTNYLQDGTRHSSSPVLPINFSGENPPETVEAVNHWRETRDALREARGETTEQRALREALEADRRQRPWGGPSKLNP